MQSADSARRVEQPAGSPLPQVIQGGMGVAVSDWRLARAVSRAGQLGVVSGTALDVVVARRLQDGDPGGHVQRALDAFPVPAIAERIRRRYLRPHGRRAGQPYTPVPKISHRAPARAVELSIVANFVEVWLAKEGHDGLVGVNYLEKVQMATPSAAYGALLAGVDYVLMGAGIPSEIPQLLDQLARHEPARLNLHVEGATAAYTVELDPEAITARRPRRRCAGRSSSRSSRPTSSRRTSRAKTRPARTGSSSRARPPAATTPRRADACSSTTTASPSSVPGTTPTWPRSARSACPTGWPAATARRSGCTPRWTRARPGIQVGTLFALSAQSGLSPAIRTELLDELAAGTLRVRTDPLASPTGFPFKVALVDGTLSDPEVYAARPRLCDLGYLRVPFERAPGRLSYRCPAEPVDEFVRKGGTTEQTTGRACLCNALTATVGLGQTRKDGYREVPVATLGNDLDGASRLAALEPDGWTAERAIDFLVSAG